MPTSAGVLVVDDHPSTRALLRSLVEEAGCVVVGEAASGADAVRLAAELRPDLITMDLDMPGVDGATATRLICEQLPDVVVVVVSGSDSTELLAKAMAAGAVRHVRKAVVAAELPATLQTLLRAHV